MSGTNGSRRWHSLISGKGIACPICGADHGCALASDGVAVVCLRVEQGCARHKDTKLPYTLKGGMGWLHFLDSRDHKGKARPDRVRINGKPIVPKLTPAQVGDYLKAHKRSLTTKRLEHAAEALKVSARSLQLLGIGYAEDFACYSFPMFDGRRKPIGVRLRGDDGRKLCVPGSTNGIFITEDFEYFRGVPGLSDDGRTPWLAMPEGPTSTAAAIDLGFRAIGRPSSSGGDPMIVDLLRRGPRTQGVVIFSDHEQTKWRKDADGNPIVPFWPGWEGAIGLGEAIMREVEWLKIVKAPDKAKDLREYFKSGGNAEGVYAEVVGAVRMNPARLRERREEVEAWRRQLSKRGAQPVTRRS